MLLKIRRKDIIQIVSNAKKEMVGLSLPLYVTDKEIEPGEIATIAVINAFLGFLNQHDALYLETKIDFTHTAAGHDQD